MIVSIYNEKLSITSWNFLTTTLSNSLTISWDFNTFAILTTAGGLAVSGIEPYST